MPCSAFAALETNHFRKIGKRKSKLLTYLIWGGIFIRAFVKRKKLKKSTSPHLYQQKISHLKRHKKKKRKKFKPLFPLPSSLSAESFSSQTPQKKKAKEFSLSSHSFPTTTRLDSAFRTRMGSPGWMKSPRVTASKTLPSMSTFPAGRRTVFATPRFPS